MAAPAKGSGLPELIVRLQNGAEEPLKDSSTEMLRLVSQLHQICGGATGYNLATVTGQMHQMAKTCMPLVEGMFSVSTKSY